MFSEWMQKFIAFSVSLLAMAGIVLGIRKEAADSREDEIKRKDAENIIDAINKAKIIENNVHEEVNNAVENGSLDKLGAKWMRK